MGRGLGTVFILELFKFSSVTSVPGPTVDSGRLVADLLVLVIQVTVWTLSPGQGSVETLKETGEDSGHVDST